MKNSILTMVLTIVIPCLHLNAQVNINNIITGATSGQNLGAGLSNDKIVSGLKEALTKGTNNSTAIVSKLDGFYKNPKIKIPFPKEARQMESTLKSIGMSKQVDEFVKTLNRAAEDAAKQAAPIFVNAIKKMTVNDGLKILRGGNNAATEFLKASTSAALMAQFKPVVQSSLQRVQITRHWTPLVKSYNRVPMVKKMNPDLNAYVTQKAVEGLFIMIAEEEAKIRKDPFKTGSNLLNEVFGGR
jgi:hypothetical protein